MSDSVSPFDAIFMSSGLDPNEAAQRSMRPHLPKRFWKKVTLGQRDGVYTVLLDGRSAKTPGRLPLASRHEVIGQRMMAEWESVGERMDPALMPMTKLINVALDATPSARDGLLDDVQAYAGSDLLCYRADGPQGLVDRQNTVWDPYLDRLRTHHGLSLKIATGIVHVAQAYKVLEGLRALADRRAGNMEALVALHLAMSLSGSAILALAMTEPGEDEGRAKAIWLATHVDEDWNRTLWGEDAEATALRAIRWRDFEAAAFVLSVTRTPDG